jgi:hypothetical protein
MKALRSFAENNGQFPAIDRTTRPATEPPPGSSKATSKPASITRLQTTSAPPREMAGIATAERR